MAELLAPVGNVEALKVAIACGADAVYLGLDCFNARIKANNFTRDNIKHYIDYCHLFGVKVYITFNTNVKQSELDLFANYVDVCANAGADAFIVTDLGCLDIYKQYTTPLHASTQFGVHNLYGAKILENLGFSRVVLARETLEEDILAIKSNTNLEIEYFVHGALCVSFSGGCLMSSMMSGDSGNRGLCNQPCRQLYASSYDDNPKYLLSPKDQCLIDKLDKLISLGVDSLKIEGRLKQPHYVGEVVSQYRYTLDNKQLQNNALNKLKRAYNRGGFTQGYNYDSTKNIMFPYIQGNVGEKIGKVIKCTNNSILINTAFDLKEESGIKIITNNKELGGLEIRTITPKGKNLVEIESNTKYPIGSDIHLTLDIEQVNYYKNIVPKLPISVNIVANVHKPFVIELRHKDFVVQKTGNIVEPATNQPISVDKLRNQIDRFGESNFVMNDCNIDCDQLGFLPLSTINNMRAVAVQELQDLIISHYNNNIAKKDYSQLMPIINNTTKTMDKNKPFVEIHNIEQLDDILIEKCNIVMNYSLFDNNTAQSIINNPLIHNNNNNIFIKLPKICRGKDKQIIQNLLNTTASYCTGIVCDNLYSIYLANKYNLLILGGLGLNIFNNNYAKWLGLDWYMPSIELTLQEIKQLDCDAVFGFGHLPVMTLTHCPIQINTNCTCANCKYNGKFYYKDRKMSYLLTRQKLSHCYFDVHNPNIIDIRSKINRFDYNFYLNMLQYNNSEIHLILNDYINKSGKSCNNSTYGHYFRGVK